jgi:hypothetical protein
MIYMFNYDMKSALQHIDQDTEFTGKIHQDYQLLYTIHVYSI